MIPYSFRNRLALHLLLAGSVALVFLTTGCQNPPAAVIKNQIISSTVSGSADDADPATPPGQYPSAANPRSAADAATTAASDPPVFNQVGGNAHAIPGANAKNGEAAAKSNSRVLTRLTVTTAGAFTFDTNLDLQAIKIAGAGRVEVFVQTNVLDANGTVILQPNGQPAPNTQAASANFKFEPDGHGGLHAIINGDAANPDPVPATGNYSRRISGPNGGVQLAAGDYTVELELRIYAFAPLDPRSKAEVDKGTAAVKLR